MNSRVRRLSWMALVALVVVLADSATAAAGPFRKINRLTVSEGESRKGDLYFFGNNADIVGTLDGDMIGFANSTVISGEVTGDVVMFGQTVDISGTVRDAVRVWAQRLHVTGTVEGDLLSGSAFVNLHPRSHIQGGVYSFAGTATFEGTVDGDLAFTGGEVTIDGVISGNVEIKADAIRLGENANIIGDLTYTARKELDLGRPDAVSGEIVFKEKLEEEDEDDRLTLADFLWWGWQTFAALLVGFVALALCSRNLPALTAPIANEPMLGTLIGFGSFLVVPAASVLAIVLIISLPLGLISLIVFLITLYLAKLPVALWLGQRLLGLVGGAALSPYLALTVGVVVLYAVFEIPYYIGVLAKLATWWLGLGTIILAARNRLQARQESAAEA